MSQDFAYLSTADIYLDNACQSLRPESVINSLDAYYREFNSCGERAKYAWGVRTDEQVKNTRKKLLKYLKLKPRDYFVSFTLNTTYGINLILNQLNFSRAGLTSVTTSEIEHNSPFLATMSFAKKWSCPRHVLKRNPDGSLNLADLPEKTLLVVNCASNIDGRKLLNLSDVVRQVHKTGGYVVIDAAQAMAHSSEILHKTSADAICFSAHKLYAPSLGGIIMRQDFAPLLDTTFIGGGMVDDVDRESYQLSSAHPDHLYTKFEAGLQAWGEIIALGAALDWLTSLPKSAHQTLAANSAELFSFLSSHDKIHLINREPNPTISFFVNGLDSHLLGSALAREGIMARTGYFCVHYYLDHVLGLPPLIRFSLGHHNRPSDIALTLDKLKALC